MRHSASAVILLVLGGPGIVSCSTSSSQTPAASAQTSGASPQLAAATQLTPSVSLQETDKGTRIFGPQLELIRDDKGIRGQSPSGIVDLSPTKDGFSGIIGTGTTNIRIEPTSKGNFNMRGMFAGALGNLEVSDDRIQGNLGRCQFDLNGTPIANGGRTYTGDRICGGRRATSTLTLPQQVWALKPFDRAAVITLMLVR
jgi:hypothetical protein